jgi:hypothetical protein
LEKKLKQIPGATINANKSMHIEKNCKIDINKHINYLIIRPKNTHPPSNPKLEKKRKKPEELLLM